MSAFGATVGERSSEGRDEYLRYHTAAIDVPSPTVDRLAALSAETNIFIVIGCIERDGGSLYCTVLFVDPQAGYLAKHRKLMPTGSERLIWAQGDGSTLPVLDKTFTNGLPVKTKISAAICWYVLLGGEVMLPWSFDS